MKHLKTLSILAMASSFANSANAFENKVIFDKCGLTITKHKNTLTDSASANWNLKQGKNGNDLWIAKNPELCGNEVEVAKDSLGYVKGIRILTGKSNELRFDDRVVTTELTSSFSWRITGGVTSEMCEKARALPVDLKECSKAIRSLGIGDIELSGEKSEMFLQQASDLEADNPNFQRKQEPARSTSFNDDIFFGIKQVIDHCGELAKFEQKAAPINFATDPIQNNSTRKK